MSEINLDDNNNLTGRMWNEFVCGGVTAGRVRSSWSVWSVAAGRRAANKTCQPAEHDTTNHWRHLSLVWTGVVQSQNPDRQHDRDACLCHRQRQIHAYNEQSINQSKHILQRHTSLANQKRIMDPVQNLKNAFSVLSSPYPSSSIFLLPSLNPFYPLLPLPFLTTPSFLRSGSW